MVSPTSIKAISSLLLGLGFVSALVALLYQYSLARPPKPICNSVGHSYVDASGFIRVESIYHQKTTNLENRLWTADELAFYNGTDEGLPLLLSILGSVFDVTKGKSHYGPGGGYHHFSGRDASRAFTSGNFTGDGLTDSLQGLTSEQVNSVVNWRKFYTERYIYVGKLVGRYYDQEGNPTKYLKGVETKAKRGAQLLEKQKNEESKIPGCNSKWSQSEGGEVWCDVGYPRLMRRPGDIELTGQISQRCVCLKEEELTKPGLVEYKGCGYLSRSCVV